MGMLVDLFKSFSDMAKLGKLQKVLEEACNKLDADGKLPEDIKTAMKAISGEQPEGTKASVEVEKLETFIKAVEAHADIFPADLKDEIAKFASATDDLEKVTADVESKAKSA